MPVSPYCHTSPNAMIVSKNKLACEYGLLSLILPVSFLHPPCIAGAHAGLVRHEHGGVLSHVGISGCCPGEAAAGTGEAFVYGATAAAIKKPVLAGRWGVGCIDMLGC